MKDSKVNIDYLKAIRRGSRDAEIENSTGWYAKNKKHKTLKDYSRKGKNKLYKQDLEID